MLKHMLKYTCCSLAIYKYISLLFFKKLFKNEFISDFITELPIVRNLIKNRISYSQNGNHMGIEMKLNFI